MESQNSLLSMVEAGGKGFLQTFAKNLLQQAVLFYTYLEMQGKLDEEGESFLAWMRDREIDRKSTLGADEAKGGSEWDESTQSGENESKTPEMEGKDGELDIKIEDSHFVTSNLSPVLDESTSEEEHMEYDPDPNQRQDHQTNHSEEEYEVHINTNGQDRIERAIFDSNDSDIGLQDRHDIIDGDDGYREPNRRTTSETIGQAAEEITEDIEQVETNSHAKGRRKGKRPAHESTEDTNGPEHSDVYEPQHGKRKRSRRSQPHQIASEDHEVPLSSRKRPEPGTYTIPVVFDDDKDDDYVPSQETQVPQTPAPKPPKVPWPTESTLKNVKMKKTVQMQLDFSSQTVRAASQLISGEGPSNSNRHFSRIPEMRMRPTSEETPTRRRRSSLGTTKKTSPVLGSDYQDRISRRDSSDGSTSPFEDPDLYSAD